jgi:uncharacterized protein (TIGR02147 family)
MVKNIKTISIYDYTDYRKYLSDFYSEQKAIHKSFSYRYFAKKAGVNSVGLYKDVVEGRQHLGRALIFKFSSAFGHTKKEAEYFENMVFFNEAKTAEERTLFFERMIATQSSKARIVDSAKFEYYRNWYFSAVRALIPLRKFKDDPADFKIIAKILNPQIRPDQAEKAVHILEKYKFIEKDSDGYYKLNDTALTTGTLKPEKNVAALNVINYQKETMKLAAGAFDRFGSEMLSMSTLTLSVSEKMLNVIKEDLAALRTKIAVMTGKDDTADRVIQLNIQLFPTSNICKEGSHE